MWRVAFCRGNLTKPLTSARRSRLHRDIAQLAEQKPFKLCVAGSIPVIASFEMKKCKDACQ